MSIFDTIFNASAASAANKRAFEYTKQLQQHQYDLNRAALREYYTNNRYSLEQAGYNPLLAIPGSTAQGFSASASMSPVMPGSSGAVTDEANVINSALSSSQQRKVAKQQVKQSKEQTKSLELDNQKKELDLKTNLKNIAVNSLEGKSLPSFITNGLKHLKNNYGVDLNPSSAKSNMSKERPVINLSDGKPYIQKGVPKSVVKSFDSKSSALSVLDKLPRNPHIGTFKHPEGKKYKYSNNRPPKSLPSGM